MVDDEEMSSQGSVNAPVARPSSPVVQGPTYQAPAELPPWAVLPKESILAEAAPTQQSIFAGPLGGSAATTIPVQSTEVLATPTVPVDSPTRAETQQAFAEVSSALRGVSSQHEEVRSRMQELASGVEALRRARASDVETTAQVQATLQRTISASSSMEYRLEQTAEEQRKARCWRRFFWRWALSPLRFGSFRKFVARSTMMLHGRCIPRHEYRHSAGSGYKHVQSSAPGCLKVKPQFGHGSMFRILLLRRGRCERSQSQDLQFTKEENELQ